MTNAIEPEGLGYVIAAQDAPNEDQRSFMARRAGEIDSSLSPAPENVLLSEITALLRTMAMRGGDQSELEAVVRVYMEDVGDVPAFALSRACRAFRRGEAGNGTFAPTPAELRKLALTYVEPWSLERGKLLRILNAKVLPPITRESKARKEAALAHARETAEILTQRSTTGFGGDDRARRDGVAA